MIAKDEYDTNHILRKLNEDYDKLKLIMIVRENTTDLLHSQRRMQLYTYLAVIFDNKLTSEAVNRKRIYQGRHASKQAIVLSAFKQRCLEKN